MYRVFFVTNAAALNVFHRIFPTLEHFECITAAEFGQLVSFLERNSSIKGLRIVDLDLLDMSSDTIKTTRLDYLDVDITTWRPMKSR